MSLEFQVVPVNFGKGVKNKTDKKMAVEGSLSVLENGVFDKALRISKRNGYTKLGESIIGGGSSIGASDALSSFTPSPGVDELIQFGGNNLYSYSPTQSQWINKDACQSVILKYRNIYRNNNSVIDGDAAVNGNLECYVWRDLTSGMAGGTTIDSQTGVEYYVGTFNTSKVGSRTKAVSIGSFIYVFYVENAGSNLVWRRVSTAAPTTFSAETIVGAVSAGTPAFDVVSDGTNIWVTYFDGANVQLAKLDVNGASVATASFAKVIANALTLAVSTNVFVYWFNAANGVEYRVYSSALANTLATTVIDADIVNQTYKITAIATSATVQRVFYAKGALPTLNHVTRTLTVNNVGTVSAATIVSRALTIASKAFSYNAQIYFWGLYVSTLQSTLFLFRSDGVCVGKAFPGEAFNTSTFSLSSVPLLSSGQYVYAHSIANVRLRGGISSVAIDFANANAFQSRMLGRNLHMIGGFLSMYDGNSVVEHGFHMYPDSDTLVFTPGGGGSIAAGTYQYAVLYEWIDNTGQIHRSATSIPRSVVVGVNGTVSIDIPTLRITEKKAAAGEVTIQIYRTLASGTVFHNIKQNSDPILYNDTSVDTVNFVDSLADASISSNELIYTTGDVLDNDPAPSCSLIDVYQNRMVLAGFADPLEFGYSKTQVNGEGVAFSDVFVTRVDPLGGDISAIKLMDDKVIIFKENTIFFVSGEGPSDTGQSDNYSIPQLITSDVGCIYPKSVVQMPLGLMFKSNKGIYLLTRSLQLEYIGADVEDYNLQNVTAATLIQDKNQVRFLTDSGSTLVYDYFFQQWSTFTNHQGDDAVNWLDKYTYLRTNGQVYNQSAGYLDDASGIVMKPVTAWVKFAGIQGFQRVRKLAFLGDYKSAHQMRVRVGYDYDDAYADTYTFDATTNIGSSAVPYEFRIHLGRQKCAALRFEFSDILPGSPGESYNISDLSLEVGIKRGINKLSAAKSA
jgi:hypothetical protein